MLYGDDRTVRSTNSVHQVRGTAPPSEVSRERGQPPGRLAWGPIVLAEGVIMFTDTAVTMQDLELESAELLPSRETLCGPCYCPCAPCLSISVCVSLCVGI
jgi:hypothetical protein